MALYRDKITMEATGEIWIEEESPIFLQLKDMKIETVGSVSFNVISIMSLLTDPFWQTKSATDHLL